MSNLLKIAIKKIRHIPRQRLRSRLVSGIRKFITGYPSYLSIQTVSACNLKCKHCFINDYHTEIHDGVVKIMKFHDFVMVCERLRPMIRHASYMTFSTFEAILNKNLFQMMDLVLSINRGMQFPFLSNTMELSAEKIALLEAYPVPEINISLDGYTPDIVEAFKTEVKFSKIVDTIKALKQSKLSDKVAVTFVAHANNVQQLPEYVDFVNGLGVKQIYVSNILTFTPALEGMELYSKTGNLDAQALFDEAVKRAAANGQRISMPRLSPVTLGCQSCETFFVDVNGNVAPCDFLAVTTPFTLWGETTRHAPVIFGNIFTDDPLSIYRSKSFRDFRTAHRNGKDLPEQCTSCIDAYGLMCSNRIHHTA